MNEREFARDFLARLGAALEEVRSECVEAVVDRVDAAVRSGASVYVMGNGGSAAVSSHFASDLAAAAGPRALRVVALGDNVARLSAIANDHGFREVFRWQLGPIVRPGDVVVAFSVSGNSENVLLGLQCARERGALTVGVLGAGGGQMGALVDEQLTVESRDPAVVESVHGALAHLVAAALARRGGGA